MKIAVRLFVLISFIMVAYVNCGRMGFEAQKGSLAGLGVLGSSACEDVLRTTYSKTYFPLLSSSCNRCHSDGHGSTNLNISFQAFMIKTVTLIDYKATNTHGDNGLNLTNQIAGLKPDWQRGQEDYLTCMSSVGTAAAGGGFKLKVNPKIIPTIAETQMAPTKWKTVEWDLETEVPSGQIGQYPAFLKIEARYALQGTDIIGFEFRNPSMRMKTAGKYLQVNGLNIYLDQKMQNDVTTYQGLLAVIGATTDTLLVANAGNAFNYNPSVTEKTEVAIEIANIQFVNAPPPPEPPPVVVPPPAPTPGTPVTFTQLTSVDPVLGVFRKSCFGCHTGATPPAGLDLSNFAMAKAKAATIMARMNDPANPMPKSGILTSAERDVVARWVSNGTPQ